MDRHEKLDQICKQFGSLQHRNPPMRIDWMPTLGWNLLFERDDVFGDTCLVYLHAENGIGVADRGKRGYTPTPCYIYEGVNGQKAVDWFNENILGLSKTESSHIVLSTMMRKR